MSTTSYNVQTTFTPLTKISRDADGHIAFQIHNEEEYAAFVTLAQKANEMYYSYNKSIMLDAEYDVLLRSLEAYEKEHGIERKDSPTFIVGGTASTGFIKRKHPIPMLSLQNAFTKEEVKAFIEKTHAAGATEWVIQQKLDGLTLVIHYAGGILVDAVTRGDGVEGEDVSHQLPWIQNIPSTIGFQKEVFIRGEVVIHKDDFHWINMLRPQKKLDLYANPRNAAAGILRTKVSNPDEAKYLRFYGYDVIFPEGTEPCLNETTKIAFCEQLGIGTVLCQDGDKAGSLMGWDFETVMKYVESIDEQRELTPYQIDGAVIKVQDRKTQDTLGNTAKFPRWALAFKYSPDYERTTLTGVTWQVGRTGVVTPVAELEPVEISGSVISRASLHNASYVEFLHANIGDSVSVYKAAEIIPQVSQILDVCPNGTPVRIPTVCPVCGTILERGICDVTCPNPNCKGRVVQTLIYWCSKQNMDIKGIGPAFLEAAYDKADVRTVAQLYDMTPSEIGIVSGLGLEAAMKLWNAIQDSKKQPFHRVLAGLGLKYLGPETAKKITKAFHTFEEFNAASIQDMEVKARLGEDTALSIDVHLHEPEMQTLIQELQKRGINFKSEDAAPVGGKLSGKRFCITGTLSVPRDDIRRLIEANGGIFMAAISSTTNYLVAGEGGGGKRSKAKQLNIPVITETELRNMVLGD